MVAKLNIFRFEYVLIHFIHNKFHDAKLRELNIGQPET